MAGVRINLAEGGAIGPEHVDQVLKVHLDKRLQLATTVGLQGAMDLNGSPQAFVTELLRLARLGALAEQTARTDPATRISTVVRSADAVWNLGLGR
jgi:hypothetical protein